MCFFVQTNHTRKELLFLMFKEINLRNHSSLHKLFYSLGSDGDPTFSGKFITIYPATFNLFKTYIDMLYNIQELKTDSSIFVMTDRRYKDSNNIFYRYGAISRKDGYIVSPKGNKIRDSRKIGYQLPSFINEPFPNNYDDNLKGRYIFKKYIPKNSWNFKPSGSVFEVTNKYNNIDNTLFLIDGTFHNVNVSFLDGNLGLINVIKMAEEAKICFL